MGRQKTAVKNVLILGIGSDIGVALAEQYANEGYAVTGTYRHIGSVNGLLANRAIRLIRCDIGSKSSIRESVDKYKKSSKPWDVFISCVGSMEPIGKFFTCDFDKWEQSVLVNSISQLRFLYEIYPSWRFLPFFPLTLHG